MLHDSGRQAGARQVGWRGALGAIPEHAFSEALRQMNLGRDHELTPLGDFRDSVAFLLRALEKDCWRFLRLPPGTRNSKSRSSRQQRKRTCAEGGGP